MECVRKIYCKLHEMDQTNEEVILNPISEPNSASTDCSTPCKLNESMDIQNSMSQSTDATATSLNNSIYLSPELEKGKIHLSPNDMVIERSN